MRINRVTTKTGDKGKTRLGDGQEVSKNSARIRCLGGMDEISTGIGLSLVVLNDSELATRLTAIQNDLLNIGGELAIPGREGSLLEEQRLLEIEQYLEVMNSALPPLEEFILPGGSEFSARIHHARVVTRRVETDLVALSESAAVSAVVLKYINRLSDYLFVLARWYNKRQNQSETLWDYQRRR